MAKEVKRSIRKTPAEPKVAGAETIRKSNRTATAMLAAPSDEQIRARAYEIYLSRNGAPGDPGADWAQAERELREQRS